MHRESESLSLFGGLFRCPERRVCGTKQVLGSLRVVRDARRVTIVPWSIERSAADALRRMRKSLLTGRVYGQP